MSVSGDAEKTSKSCSRGGRWTRWIRRRPITALLLWFFTVGQAVAFVPVICRAKGMDVPLTPFVLASNMVGLVLPTLIIMWISGGTGSLWLLWRRSTAVRVGAGWYAFALVVVPLTTLAIAAAAFGLPREASLPAWGAAVLLGLLLPTALGLVAGNLGEEVAWMGLVQARLQDRHGPFLAAVLSAPLFGLQHLPLVVSNAGEGAPLLMLLLILLAIPFRALLGWSYNRTGSLFLVGLIHASGNAVAGGALLADGLLPRLYPETSSGPLHILAFAVLGLLVLGATRARLGLPRPAAGNLPPWSTGRPLHMPDASAAVRSLTGRHHILDSPAPILVGGLVAGAGCVADASSGEANLGLVSLAVMAMSLALTLTQAVRARVGRPWRTSRLAASVGTAACLFVVAFLSLVGVLERMGPQVTSSPPFAAGVAGMSVILLMVLPFSLVVFGWGVWADRRLPGWMRVLPMSLVCVVVVAAVTVAVARGNLDLWLQAAAVSVTGALLTGLSVGLSRAGHSGGSERQPAARTAPAAGLRVADLVRPCR